MRPFCKLQILVMSAWALASVTTAADQIYSPPRAAVEDTRSPQKVCEHPIYCDGPILRAIQLGSVFDSDKTFIDMPTRKPVSDIVHAFGKLPLNATRGQLAAFVHDNFYPAGSDVVEVELEDWNDDPPFLKGIVDPVLRGYGLSLHNQWKTLGRKRDTSFLCAGCESSLLPVNHTFIASGSKTTREFHYWNTYYVELGLLQSGLYKTARGVLQNLLDTIALYGFVPSGGRIYYTDRTEPPLLALMVKTYFEATQDLDFVTAALPLLKRELAYWDKYRSVNVTYTRNITDASLGKRDHIEVVTSKTTTFGPNLFSTAIFNRYAYLRPETYSSDYTIAKTSFSGPSLFSTALSYGSLYAATESGTFPSIQYANRYTATIGPSLFSTALNRRQLNLPKDNPFAAFTKDQLCVLGSVNINSTIPVNLNSILYQAEIIVANLTSIVNRYEVDGESDMYRKRAEERLKTMLDLTYNPDTGLFADYNLGLGQQSDVWSVNSLWPSWAIGNALPANHKQRALENIAQLHDKFPGGLPNTYYNTSLGWDYPNIKPPLQHMAIRSADAAEKSLSNDNSTVYAPYKGTAAKIAQSTIETAFCNWYTTGGSIPGVLNSYGSNSKSSSGVSLGSFIIGPDGNAVTATNAESQGDFTWTTGITIWLLNQYKSQLRIPSCPNIKLNLVNKVCKKRTRSVRRSHSLNQ
ncbi:Six-hairpin glycosidase-like protein [Kickxella alabastrina]|uniref:Six-hairpin glycosidase-like protein n=1 Tax=Kickxella alabastrina TaxID=61397 RepID=UPI0022210F00|nr:Six-hairpin glycosidase-like protein [Kickxella alabastrina]KAI7825884.1 Six-hairpin glycosidase-like protein [Kickxella alabastrina]KAJ1947265.1 hypothetical protein GGF37_000567 [Kickxella alabastrina]